MTTESSHDALRRVVDKARTRIGSKSQHECVVVKTEVEDKLIDSWSPLIEEHATKTKGEW